MTVRRRRSDRSGRSKLHSPGRPDSARREELVRFWAAIATGRSSEDAARDAGVSPPVGSRWFRRSGGMPPSHLSQSAKPLSGRYLSFEEREEIALLRAQGRGIRHIACRLERAPSTISCEVRRNAATRSGGLDCGACATVTGTVFPDGVTAPVQYGPRITAWVSYLLYAQFVPEKRLAELMSDLFAVSISTATITAMGRLGKGVEAALDQHRLQAVIKHMTRRARHLRPAHHQVPLTILLPSHRHRQIPLQIREPENQTAPT